MVVYLKSRGLGGAVSYLPILIENREDCKYFGKFHALLAGAEKGMEDYFEIW